MENKKLYKEKYFILSTGIKRIAASLKKDIYSGQISPSALRYMSDLKFLLLCAEKRETETKNKKARVRAIKCRKTEKSGIESEKDGMILINREI